MSPLRGADQEWWLLMGDRGGDEPAPRLLMDHRFAVKIKTRGYSWATVAVTSRTHGYS